MSEAIQAVKPVGRPNSSLELIENTDVNKMASQLQAISNFQSMVEKTLVSGQDYGVIPGTNKPTLLKPGAEKIQMLMGVASEFEVIDSNEDYKNGYFDYTVKCRLAHNGQQLTEGLGSANTKESKYVSRDGWSMKNTVLKMAKKRAQVDATLTIASLSNVFTQDVEDMQSFNNREQTETMNSGDAVDRKITFGKHKGQTYGEVLKSDRSYLTWLQQNGRNEADRKAAAIVLQQGEQRQKPASEQPHSATSSQASHVSPSQQPASAATRSLEDQMPPDMGRSVDISDEDLPFD